MTRTGARIVKVNSPAASKASNGVVDRGVQTTEGQLRMIKDAPDVRYGQVTQQSKPLWCVGSCMYAYL